MLYHAISLFAGLRHSECQLLTWENVNPKEKTVTVLATTSKTKETRNVPIEGNLLTWIEEFALAKPHWLVTPAANFAKRIKAFHAALEYRIGDKKS